MDNIADSDSPCTFKQTLGQSYPDKENNNKTNQGAGEVGEYPYANQDPNIEYQNRVSHNH